jgi:hypothetical protein
MLVKDWINRNCRFATTAYDPSDWIYDSKRNPYSHILSTGLGYDPTRMALGFRIGSGFVEIQLNDAQCHQINETYQCVQEKYKNERAIEENPPSWLRELIQNKFPAAKGFYLYDKSPLPDSYIGVNGDVAGKFLGKIDESDAKSVGHSITELTHNTELVQPLKQDSKEQPHQEM